MSDAEIGEGSVYARAKERLRQARERKPDVPLLPERTASFVFVRYIGHPQLDVNEPFLEEWAERLANWLDEGIEVYAFCHCPDETISPQICRELHRRIAARTTIDALPWDNIGDEFEGKQARLL